MSDQKITYEEALGPFNGNATRRLLENIAAGRYWNEGRQFDPPELQAKKAAAILQELDAQIAQLPNPETLPTDHCGAGSQVDVAAQIMLLRLDAEMKFDAAVTKRRHPQSEFAKSDLQKPAKVETELSGEQKLKAAKALIRSGL